MSILLGRQSLLARPLSIVAGSAALFGIAAAAYAAREPAVRRLRFLFLVWYLLPLAVLSIVPVRDYIHYFIVITPLPFLGLAYAIELIAKRRVAIAVIALAGCLTAFAVLDVRFFGTVIRDGGAPGDYGIAYRHKMDAVAAIIRANPNRAVRFGLDRRFLPSGQLRDVRFLLWNARIAAGAGSRRPRTGYLFTNRFDGRSLPRAGSATSFGPLEIVAVPLRSKTR